MSLKRKLIVNASWLLGGQTLQKVISYAIVLLISRRLGSSGLGEYSFIVVFTGFIAYVSDFGINYYIMRELARDRKRKNLIPPALSFKATLAVLDWLALVVLALLMKRPPVVRDSMIIYGAGAVLGTVGGLFTSIMFAHEVTKYEVLAATTERMLTLTIGGAVLWYTGSLLPFFIVLTMDMVLMNLLRMHFAGRFVEIRMEFNVSAWKNILRGSYVFWFIYLFSILYFNTDIIMLGLMEPSRVVGWYKAGYFFIQAAMLVPTVVVNTTMPSISRLWGEDRKTMGLLFRKTLRLLTVVGVAYALCIYAAGGQLLMAFFGPDFSNSLRVLRILAWAVPPMFITSIFGSLLNGTGNEKAYTKVIGTTALLNVVLNYLLISRISYVGAAVATLVTNWAAVVLLTRKVRSLTGE